MKRTSRIQGDVMTATVLMAVAAALIAGCGSKRSPVNTANSEAHAAVFANRQEPREYRIHAGDELDVKFFFNPELNESLPVRPDGKISLQLVGEVQAAGMTPTELDANLTRLYARELRQPVVNVIVRSFTGERVYVGGEVGRPGLVDLTAGMTASQAVFFSGGFLESAELDSVLLIRKGPQDAPVPIRLDLAQALRGEGLDGDIYLQPSDIVYVPRTWIASANLFIRQYIAGLLQFRGISLGFNLTDFIFDD